MQPLTKPNSPSGAIAPTADASGLSLALLMLLVLAFVRSPAILMHGRMWSEELTTFMADSWNHPVMDALLKQHFGYYSIWDNVLGVAAAHWLPLTWAALVFSWSAVVNLLLTGYLVYEAEFLRTRTSRLLAVLALILITPNVETWLNVLNSEFYFGIWAAIILVSDAGRLQVQRGLLLLLAVLSGPLTTLLAPIYFVRAVLDRQRNKIVQAAIVCVGGLFQIGVAIHSSISDRKVVLHPENLGPILFNKNLVMFFLSRPVAKLTYLFMDRLHFNPAVFVVTWALLLLAVYGFFLLSRGRPVAVSLLLLALWMTVLETTLALNSGLIMVASLGERYAYTPNYLLALALIVLATQLAQSPRRMTARTLLGLAFFSGVVEFVLFPTHFRHYFDAQPWRQQVLRWEKDPGMALKGSPEIWPAQHLAPRQPPTPH